MKKILLSANNSFVLYNFRYGLMKELEKNGYTIVMVSEIDEFKKKLEKHWKFIDVNIDRRGKNIINDLKLIWSYYKIYKKEKPDYILHFTIKPNIYGTLAAKLLNIPTINNITGLGEIFSTPSLTQKIVKLLYKISFKYPKKVLFQNNDDLNLFLDNRLIKKDICERVSGSGVNIQKFIPLDKRLYNEIKRKILLYQNDIFILPSYDKAQPISILEAYATGCAVITDESVGGIKDIFEDNINGLNIKNKDINDIYKKIKMINPTNYIENNYTIYQQYYTETKFVKRIEDILIKPIY